jgi:hypothetical protein
LRVEARFATRKTSDNPLSGLRSSLAARAWLRRFLAHISLHMAVKK